MAVTVDTNAKLLVTGASGQLGQLVVKHLLDTLKVTPANIVAGSRNPDKLKAFADRGVKTVRIDFNDAATVEEAAKGIDRALLISSDDMFNRLTGQKVAVAAFAKAGVKHILYTSIHNVDKSIAFGQADHAGTEAAIVETKISYTFLRNGMYFENALGSVTGAKHTGKWPSAAKDGKLAALSRDDLALANASALASNNYDNQIYELTGSVGRTVEEFAANISKAIGKTIEVAHVTVDELAQGVVAATGWPLEAGKAVASFDTNTAAGNFEPVGDDFEKLVGRKPHSHEEWVEANKEMLIAL